MKEFFKKAWKVIDGNKTIICLTLLKVSEYVPIPEPAKSIVTIVLSAGAGGSAIHHIQKGYLFTKKGN